MIYIKSDMRNPHDINMYHEILSNKKAKKDAMFLKLNLYDDFTGKFRKQKVYIVREYSNIYNIQIYKGGK